MNVKKLLGLLCLFVCVTSYAQSPAPTAPTDVGYPLTQVLATVSKNINKSIFAEPDVNQTERALIFGKDLSALDYNDLLRILQLHGYTAYELNGSINVVAINHIRTQAVPTVVSNGKYSPNQFVTKVISLDKTCSVHVLPMLRPLFDKNAHMTASPDSNSLILMDSYANIQRIESVIEGLEKSTDKKQKCEPMLKKG